MRATDLRVGMEVEVTAGAADLASTLEQRGLIADSTLHNYHCGCVHCAADFDRSTPWTAQQDCTVDGEFISKPLLFGSDEFESAIEGMAKAMFDSRTVVTQDGDGTGNHVHVESLPMRRNEARCENSSVVPTGVLLERMVVRYSETLDVIARAAEGRVRSYNGGPPNIDTAANYYGLWSKVRRVNRYDFETREYGTVEQPYEKWPLATGALDNYVRVRPQGVTTEFRLWNATRSPWRLRLHAGLSAAMMAAACSGEKVRQHDQRTFIDVVGPYADDETVKSYYRQVRLASQ